jgi:Predicted metal-binding integral membrane protein (DUF2182)
MSATAKPLARNRSTLITGGALIMTATALWAILLRRPDLAMTGSGLAGALLFLVGWGVMMAAMMLPSAMPMIALYTAVRGSSGTASRGISTTLFALVYLALWEAFGIPVQLASLIVSSQPALAEALPYALVVVLIAAGVYQFTPLKRACLRVCRNPLSFLWARSRAGYRIRLETGIHPHAAIRLYERALTPNYTDPPPGHRWRNGPGGPLAYSPWRSIVSARSCAKVRQLTVAMNSTEFEMERTYPGYTHQPNLTPPERARAPTAG